MALACLCTVVIVACGPYQSRDFYGHWQGILLTEEGDTLAIDPSLIRFHFDKKQYTFSSTLNYQESGEYHIKGDVLFTTDQQTSGAREKAVLIKYLQNDTLILGMKDNGRNRELKLKRLAD